MPRHQRTPPPNERIKAVLEGYRALPPHEKMIALFEMGFTQRDAEGAILLEMRRAAKEAMEQFAEAQQVERDRNRKPVKITPLDEKGKPGKPE